MADEPGAGMDDGSLDAVRRGDAGTVATLAALAARPDLLAGRLADEDGTVRLWAVYGLAERDDPRCLTARPPAEAPGPRWSWIREAPERYERRRESRAL